MHEQTSLRVRGRTGFATVITPPSPDVVARGIHPLMRRSWARVMVGCSRQDGSNRSGPSEATKQASTWTKGSFHPTSTPTMLCGSDGRVSRISPDDLEPPNTRMGSCALLCCAGVASLKVSLAGRLVIRRGDLPIRCYWELGDGPALARMEAERRQGCTKILLVWWIPELLVGIWVSQNAAGLVTLHLGWGRDLMLQVTMCK